jgi:DNA helicase-2/ATP-dependent DNA helicase PcrA
VLDNGRWTKYNFKQYFEENGKDTIIERTSRLFYVCCSRAMNNLVVYCADPSSLMLVSAKKKFGETNVKEIQF